jgi:F-type H+-transporting ATPase subunit a
MNIVSDVAQPASMALCHFGNVAGGGVITSILYTALGVLSATILNAIASNGGVIAIVLLVVGVVLLVLWRRKKKTAMLVFGIVMAVLGVFGGLQALGVLSGVPLLAFGIPAVLSLYFDLFSSFVQALVFSLLTMVYIGAANPPPEPSTKVEEV